MLAKNERSSLATSVQRPTCWHWLFLSLLVLFFVGYYSAQALRQHGALITGVDLADYDQAVWSTAHGHPFWMTTYSNITNWLGVHVELILLAIVPLYALFPSPKTLLVLQVVALALVAWPLYSLAAEAWGRPTWALAFPVLYVLSPVVHNAALSDFHAITLGIWPAMAALLAVWRGQTRSALLFGFLALLAREDYGLWLAALAVVGWWRSRKRLWIGVALAGLGWFLVSVLLVPLLFVSDQRSVFWDRYSFWLDGPASWQAQGLLAEKGRYLVMLLLMGSAGALLAPLWALPALPALGLNLLANYHLPISLEGYYSALLMPVLLAASAIGLRRLRSRWQVLTVLLFLTAALGVHRYKGRSPLVPGYQPAQPSLHSETLPAMLAHIPAEGGLSVSPSLAPHASGRLWLRIFPQRSNCEFVLVDLYQDRSRHPLDMRRRVLNLLSAGWGIHAAEHGFLLLEQGLARDQLPDSFFAFARPVAEPQYPVQALFAGGWELQGYDIFWDYWGRPAARLYWRVRERPAADWQPAALALGGGGEVLATPDTHPPVVLLWLPTSQWQPGETYVVEMLPFEASDRVSLEAGIGAPLADPTTRLSTEAGQDLVRLATLERQRRTWQVHPLP
jgi:uncharacterized membrane protein